MLHLCKDPDEIETLSWQSDFLPARCLYQSVIGDPFIFHGFDHAKCCLSDMVYLVEGVALVRYFFRNPITYLDVIRDLCHVLGNPCYNFVSSSPVRGMEMHP